METKAYLVIMSHLSDVQESMGYGVFGTAEKKQNVLRLNFAKYLIVKYSHNLEVYIDPDEDFKEFKTKYPNA